MADHAVLDNSTAYRLDELFSDVERMLTRDITSASDTYRRNLHRVLIHIYEELMNTSNFNIQSSDVPLLARGSLQSIKSKAQSAAGLSGMTGMHAKDLIARIDEILDND